MNTPNGARRSPRPASRRSKFYFRQERTSHAFNVHAFPVCPGRGKSRPLAVESFADPFPSTPRMTSQDDPFGTHPPLLVLSGARLYQKSCPPSRSHFQGVNTPRGRSREKTTKRSSSAFTSSCEARRASLLHFSAPSSPGQKILSNTKDVHRQGMPLVACQRSATRHQ